MANPNVLNMRGTAAARPAAGIDGRHYWAYDTKAMSRDNGSTWETVTPAAGASGSILAIDGSGDLAYTPTLTQGDTFPVAPSDLDQHFRTDLGLGYTWDDTLGYWLGPEVDWPMPAQSFVATSGFTSFDPHLALPGDKLFLITRWRLTYIGPDDPFVFGVDSYIFTLRLLVDDGSSVTLETFTIDTDPGGGAAGLQVSTSLANNLTASNHVGLQVSFDFTGAPGTLSSTFWHLRVREAIAP